MGRELADVQEKAFTIYGKSVLGKGSREPRALR